MANAISKFQSCSISFCAMTENLNANVFQNIHEHIVGMNRLNALYTFIMKAMAAGRHCHGLI